MRTIFWRGLVAVCGFACLLGVETAEARQVVQFDNVPAGTIVISNRQRALFLSLGDGRAIRYSVAVGRVGKAWTGQTYVRNMVANPTWQAPEIVRRDFPNLPPVIGPGPRNPLGTRAIVLGKEEIAIHGTNMPSSIGRAASYGCIRMHNRDVEDLFNRISVGAPVLAMN